MALTPTTIPEVDADVNMQTLIRDSARKFIKAESALAGISMGDFIIRLLLAHTSYRIPEHAQSGGQTATAPAAKP
jgi:hypothetical protein